MTMTVVNRIACIGAEYWGQNLIRNFNDWSVLGNPVRIIGWLCVCGNRINFAGENGLGMCPVCQWTYKKVSQKVSLGW